MGSLEEYVLFELSNRQKNLQFAQLYAIVVLLKDGLNVSSEKIEAVLDLYEAELHQDTYDPTFIEHKRLEIQEKTLAFKNKVEKFKQEKSELLSRVEAMGVKDD